MINNDKGKVMKLTILRIENQIINCQLDDGTIIDIAQRWFAEDILEGDTIEFDMHDCNKE